MAGERKKKNQGKAGKDKKVNEKPGQERGAEKDGKAGEKSRQIVERKYPEYASDKAGVTPYEEYDAEGIENKDLPGKAKKAAAAKKGKPKPDRKFSLMVGIGASAGGLEAINQFLDHLDDIDCCTFFVVQHQSEQAGKTVLTGLLEKHTSHKVLAAEDGMEIERGRIYVCPPGKLLAVYDGRLQVMDRDDESKMTIDYFFRSLAGEARGMAVAVVLSGSNTDGTLGAKSIKEQNGLVIAQDPQDAQFTTMPQSIIGQGLADLVLRPSEIPKHLVDYANKLLKYPPETRISEEHIPQNQRDKLLLLLKNRTGHDFSMYKDNTINRRIRRRMDFHQLDELKDYVKYVQKNAGEAEALFRDLLIGVTNFFRDPAVFEALGDKLRDYLKGRKKRDFRGWVTGCATGEEAYSVAILLSEIFEDIGAKPHVDIYATDLDPEAIEYARKGRFTVNIRSDVSDERLSRFFLEKDGSYVVKREVREMLAFAEQNVLQDPPFSNIDLVVCRNLLMYLKTEAQRKVLAQFRYSLKPGGLMMLGTSESAASLSEPYKELDKKNRIYCLKEEESVSIARPNHDLVLDMGPSRTVRRVGEQGIRQPAPNLRQASERLLLSFAPPSVLVNRAGDILYFHGRTGKYLEPREGPPKANILDMARSGLSFDLSTGLTAAGAKGSEQVRKNVAFKTNDHEAHVDILIRPADIVESEQPCYMISFVDVAPPAARPAKAKDAEDESHAQQRIRELEGELQHTREDMQSMIEEYEAANEELKSSNEELQSTNEELKSTNEELETAKEEMQSINEEQATLNAELSSKNEELQHVSDDMQNLLSSTQVATIFLDKDLRVRRFTPNMTGLMSLRDPDAGRPVGDLRMKIDYADFELDVCSVLKDLNTVSREVQANGAWYQMRVMPYRTLDNVIDGVVATFNDITRLKKSEKEALEAKEYAESIVDTVMEPLLVLDEQQRVLGVNRSFHETFKTSEKQTRNHSLFELGGGQWDIPELRKLLQEVIRKKAEIADYVLEYDFPSLGPKRLHLNARSFQSADGEHKRVVLAIGRIEDKGGKAKE